MKGKSEGPQDEIERVGSFFESAEARYIPLNVSGAFHTSYMTDSKKEFEKFLDSFEFSRLAIPVISNIRARPYKQTDLKKNLVEQITHPVKWSESIRYLMTIGEMEFIEIGPGDVLTKLVQAIQKDPEPLIVAEEEKPVFQPVAKPAKTISAGITALSLGDPNFKRDYNLKYAYVIGSMYRGISSKELVVRAGWAGLLGFFGTGGLEIKQIEEAIKYIQTELKQGQSYGMNLLFNSHMHFTPS